MPGTPPNSPRFGAPRFSDADTAAFSAQVNGVTDIFDAEAAKRLAPHTLSASGLAVGYDVVDAWPSTVITLPAPTSEHELICIYADEAVTPTTPVEVAYGSGGGNIFGKGMTAGVASFLLGAPGAFAWLFSPDAVNWRVVNGEQDTGWVALTLGTAIGVGGGETPMGRLRGDMVALKGVAQATSPEPDGAPLVTLPVSLGRPPATRHLALPTGSLTDTFTSQSYSLSTSGQIITASGLGITSGSSVVFNGQTISLA